MGCSAHGGATGAQAAASVQLASFDQAWQRIGETFPHADMNGLDWNAVRDELRPKAARARSAADLRPILADMLGRLHESHFQVIAGSGPNAMPEAAPVDGRPATSEARALPSALGDLGFELRPLGDDLLVTRVETGSPAEQAGVRMGWTLLSADGQDTRALLRRLRRDVADREAADVEAWLLATHALQGDAGSTAALTFLTDGDGRAELRVVRRIAPGEPFQLGNLPVLVTRFEQETLPGNVGLLRFNIFLIPVAAPFSDAVRDFVASDAKGIIIDLRGNPGGIGGMVMGLAGHFIGTPGTSLGTMITREGKLDFVANPRAKSQLFEGPLAVLVDGMSVSTSELFAAGLQQVGRARVFGQPSAGMALPSIVESLPNGDRIQFAVADLLGPAGERIEGTGVVPDTPITPTREQLLAGRDPVIEAALAWIGSQDGAARH